MNRPTTGPEVAALTDARRRNVTESIVDTNSRKASNAVTAVVDLYVSLLVTAERRTQELQEALGLAKQDAARLMVELAASREELARVKDAMAALIDGAPSLVGARAERG